MRDTNKKPARRNDLHRGAAALERRTDLIGIVSIILSIGFLFVLKVDPTTSNAVASSSNAIYLPYVLAWFVLGFVNASNLARRRELKRRLGVESDEYMRLLRAEIMIAALASVLCLVGFLYLAGGHYWVRSALERFFPQVSRKVVSFLGRMLEGVFCSVLGAYLFSHYEKKRREVLRDRPGKADVP